MKKLVALLLTGTMLLSISACGKGKSTEAVNLCAYKGIDGELEVHEITDEEVQEEIDSLLEENEQQIPLDRGVKTGDYVEFNFTAKVGDETIYDFTDETYYLTVGEEEFGEEFDDKLKGAKKRDHKTFSIKYDDSYWDEQLANKEVDYDVTIDGVYELKTPELTEEYIKDTLGYESEDDMRKQLKTQLQQEYDETAKNNTQTELLQRIINGSDVTKYDKKLYEKFKKQVEEGYEANKEMLGCDTLEEVYDALGVSEEDVEDEIMFYVYQDIVVNEIAKEEKLSISDDEYQKGLEEYAASSEYEDAKSYEKDMGADNIRFWLLQEKVMDFIMENANIKEVDGESLSEQRDVEVGDMEGTEEEELSEDDVIFEEDTE